MKSLEQIRSDNWSRLDDEIDAAGEYFKNTGKCFYELSPTEQRKVIESWMEDHVYDRGGYGL